MKNLTITVLALTAICLAGFVAYDEYNNEVRLARMEKTEHALRLESSAIKAAMLALETNKPLVAAVRNLTQENSALIGREQAAAATVDGYLTENKKLKESLREAVENLQMLTDQNNDLQGDIEQLEFKIATLEKALDAAMKAIDQMKVDAGVQPADPVQPAEPPANKLPF